MSSKNVFLQTVCLDVWRQRQRKNYTFDFFQIPNKISTMPQYRCTRSILKNFEEQSPFCKKKSQHYISDLCRHLSLNQTLNQRISRQGEEKQKEYHIGLIEWIVFNRIQLVLKCLNFILNMIGWFPSSDFKYYDSILTILLAL